MAAAMDMNYKTSLLRWKRLSSFDADKKDKAPKMGRN